MKNVVKGYTRNNVTVVNTDTTKLEDIKQRRALKRRQNNTSSEVTMLRRMVEELQSRVLALESKNG